jgi:hypothetical protein
MTVQVQNILTILDMAAQKSVSAPEISQGGIANRGAHPRRERDGGRGPLGPHVLGRRHLRLE